MTTRQKTRQKTRQHGRVRSFLFILIYPDLTNWKMVWELGSSKLCSYLQTSKKAAHCAPELTPNVCGDVEFLYFPTAVYKYMNRKIEELE